MQTIPTPFDEPFEQADELYTPVSHFNNQPIATVLTAAELAAGCLVYRVPNDALAPDLKAGDYVVVQPVPRSEWADLAHNNFCLLLIDYPTATYNDQPFKGNNFLRILCNHLPYGGPLIGLRDDDASEPIPINYGAEALLEIWRLTRLIRLL